VVDTFATDQQSVLAGATAYLELVSLTVAADLLLREATQAVERNGSSAEQLVAQLNFFVAEHLDRAPSLASISVGATLLETGLRQP
jgi:hypothetical protein